jgi:hypothetical protein
MTGFMKIRNVPYTWLVFCLAAAAAAVLALMTRVNFDQFELTHPGGHVEAVTLPVSGRSTAAGGYYRLVGTLNLAALSSKHLHIIPDDEVLEIVPLTFRHMRRAA